MSLENLKLPEGEEGIDSYTDRGIEWATLRLRDRFERSPKPHNNLDFHNRAHTKDVIRRAMAILDAIRSADSTLVSEKDIVLAKLAAAFHDVVQNYEESKVNEVENEKVMRKRFVGRNESQSAEEAIAFMDKINKSEGAEIFNEDDKHIIEEAIAATVPGFDAKKGTVIQPNLKRESSFVTKALALADLGTAGIDGPARFLEEGAALFREENLDIVDAIEGLKKGKEIPESQKIYFRKRMLEWLNFQPMFARGRREFLENELGGIPEAAGKKIREELFTKFDASIEAAKKRAEEAGNLSFEDLARLMGFGF